MFTDAHYHTAWNNTNAKRYILLFDVVKPAYLDKKNVICASVLASLFLQKRAESLSFLRKTPLWIQAIVHKFLWPCVYVYLPLRNFVVRLKG